MAEIQEVFEDIKDTLGDKGFFILIIGAVAFGLYNLNKSPNSGESMTTVKALASYPDTVTNANVIIDTLQNSIDYATIENQESIQALGDDITQYLSDNFTATNDYINTGFASQEKLLEENFDDLQGDIGYINTGINSIKNTVGNLNTNVSNLNHAVKNLNTAYNASKPSTSASAGTNANTGKASSDTYLQYKTKAGLNTNTSIVDALKATGVDSSMANRATIASKNGISNYSGTYAQNVQMLNMLKAGQLKG